MQKLNLPLSVAIVTSTIGRQSLTRTIESVKNQTYPCKHYIFVDGQEFSQKVEEITAPYSDLIITYLPMNTGANGWVNSSINAIAPYLVKEDVICYLDDDNWYEPYHIESVINEFCLHTDADFIYSLRNFIDQKGNFICPDDYESLGFWENKIINPITFDIRFNGKSHSLFYKAEIQFHIDTNCYAFLRNTALQLSSSWFSGVKNDQCVYKKIMELGLRGRATQRYSVNYTIDLKRLLNLETILGLEEGEELTQLEREILIQVNQENIKRHNGKPWAEAELIYE